MMTWKTWVEYTDNGNDPKTGDLHYRVVMQDGADRRVIARFLEKWCAEEFARSMGEFREAWSA